MSRVWVWGIVVIGVLLLFWFAAGPSGEAPATEGKRDLGGGMEGDVEAPAADDPPGVLERLEYREDGPPDTKESPADEGELELRFKDDAGNPVAGVKARVGPAARVSDAEGSSAWILPPGVYQWIHEGPEILGQESQESPLAPIERGGGVVGWMRRDVAPGASVPVEVKAGETVTVVVRVHLGTRLSGRIPIRERIPSWQPTPEKLLWHEVVLIRDARMTHPSAPDRVVGLREQVGTAEVGDDGSFSFEGVPPGDLIVEAWWRDRDVLSVVREGIHVAPGEHRNLGTLQPANTQRTLQVELQRHGSPVALESLYGEQERPLVMTVLFMRNRPPSMEESWSVRVDVEPGSFVIVGLPPFCDSCTVARPPEWPDGPVPDPARVAVEPDAIRVVFEVPSPRKLVSLPVRARPVQGRLYAHLLSGSEEVAAALLTDGDGVLSAPEGYPGPWSLIVHSERVITGTAPSPAWFHGPVTLDPPIEVSLTPGAIYEGRVVDRKGDPLRETVVAFRPPGVEPWVISTRTDSDGKFRLQGMPDRLECALSAEAFGPGRGIVIQGRW